MYCEWLSIMFVFLQDLQGHNKCRLFQQGMVQHYGMFYLDKSAVIFFHKATALEGRGFISNISIQAYMYTLCTLWDDGG